MWRQLTWWAWIGISLVVMAVTLLTWTGLQVGQHLWTDHNEHHLVLEVLKYNVQVGRILPLPGPAQPPSAPRVTPPAAPAGPEHP